MEDGLTHHIVYIHSLSERSHHDCCLKGTRCLGSVELVYEKRSVTVCYKMHMCRKM